MRGRTTYLKYQEDLAQGDFWGHTLKSKVKSSSRAVVWRGWLQGEEPRGESLVLRLHCGMHLARRRYGDTPSRITGPGFQEYNRAEDAACKGRSLGEGVEDSGPSRPGQALKNGRTKFSLPRRRDKFSGTVANVFARRNSSMPLLDIG